METEQTNDGGAQKERAERSQSDAAPGSAADWERRYQDATTVLAVFATGVRKALKIESEVPLSTILDVVIAVKANSDAYMEGKYGHIWNKNKPPTALITCRTAGEADTESK